MKFTTTPWAGGKYYGAQEETDLLTYRIEHRLNEPAVLTAILRDTDGGNFQRLSRGPGMYVVMADDTVYTDYTDEASDETADDVHLLPSGSIVADEDYLYIGSDQKFNHVALDITTAGVFGTGYFLYYEYYSSATGWSYLSTPNDQTNELQAAGRNYISWAGNATYQPTWAKTTVDGISAYWIRLRVGASVTVTTQPKARRVFLPIYLSHGKAELEDPNGTTLFSGRITKVRHDSATGRTTVTCEDWLSQLSLEKVNYDMREDLDGNGLRESQLRSDIDAAYDYIEPVETGGTTYYAYDDDMSWSADQWNGYKMVLPASAADKQTAGMGVAVNSVNGTWDAPPVQTDNQYTWDDDDNSLDASDNPSVTTTHTLTLKFKPIATEGSLWQETTGARLTLTYTLDGANGDGAVKIGTNKIGTLFNDGQKRKVTMQIPLSLFSPAADGTFSVALEFDIAAGVTGTISLYYAWLEFDFVANGYSSTISITDTTANRLTVSTDLDVTGLGLWEGCPYSIIRALYHRVNGIVTAADDMQTLTTSVEATDGISTRNYQSRTRIEILRDLALADKAVFYLPLGSTQMKWKRTFSSDSTTAFTDASVLRWLNTEVTADTIRNRYEVWGIRVGDSQIHADTADLATDPGYSSRYLYGTMNEVVRGTGIMTLADASALGQANVERQREQHLYLACEMAGLSSIRLADSLLVTSSRLGLSSQRYVVTYWMYDSARHVTELRLHPSSDDGLTPQLVGAEYIRRAASLARQAIADTYAPNPYTQEWTT